MAKTFVNVLGKKKEEVPDSKKDILDFFQEESENRAGNLSPITSAETTTDKGEREEVTTPKTQEVRQTFILDQHYLERLKDYVHHQRSKGNYEYSQKNALHDALDLLFRDNSFSERPESVKQREQDRAKKIRKGIKTMGKR